MAQGLSLDGLREAVRTGRVEWRRHALERMAERGIGINDVLDTVLSGERIEDYPGTTPFPSALFLRLHGDRPLHVVVAYDTEAHRAFVITAYRPDLEHFEPDFRTRRTS